MTTTAVRYEALQPGHLPRSVGPWLVTPAWAEWVLRELNTHNRPVRRSVVARYVLDMAAGGWLLTHQGVAFSPPPSPALLDGQHRLLAVVESGVGVPMYVVVGIPIGSQLVVDDHSPRRAEDCLTLAGEPTGRTEAATALAMIGGPLGWLRGSGSRKPTKAEMLAFVRRHGEAVRWATSLPGGGGRGVSSASVLAVLARATYHAPRDQIAWFADVLFGGVAVRMLPVENTALACRTALLAGGARNGTAKTTAYQKTQRALRGFLDGEVLRKCYAAADDLFPLPD